MRYNYDYHLLSFGYQVYVLTYADAYAYIHIASACTHTTHYMSYLQGKSLSSLALCMPSLRSLSAVALICL